jgi:H+/Cl- antiporter ClcA
MAKKQTLETRRALALLVFFLAGAIAGIILIWSQLGPWKDAGFPLKGWPRASTEEFSITYLLFIGIAIFTGCTGCVVNLIRYDLRDFRRKLKHRK